jgi:hypothetical protein
MAITKPGFVEPTGITFTDHEPDLCKLQGAVVVRDNITGTGSMKEPYTVYMQYVFHLLLFAIAFAIWLAAAYFGMKWAWEWRQKLYSDRHELQTLFGSERATKKNNLN